MKVKYTFCFLAEYDSTGMIEYLNKMAAKGWILKSKSGVAYKFIKTDKPYIKYDITYFADANKENNFFPYGSDRYFEIRQAAGWQLLTNDRKMMIFITENPDATPLETDAVSMVEVVHQTMLCSYLPKNLFMVVFWLWQRSFFEISLFNILFISFLLIMLVEIIWYLKWYFKAKKLAREYDIIHKTKTPWVVLYIEPIIIAIMLCTFFEMGVIGIVLLAFMAFSILRIE